MVVSGRFWSILVGFFPCPFPRKFWGVARFLCPGCPCPPPRGNLWCDAEAKFGAFLFSSLLSLSLSLSIFFLSFLPLSLSLPVFLCFFSLCLSLCASACPPARPPASLSLSLSLIRLDTELKMFSGMGVKKASHSKNERRQTRGASASVR